MHAQNNAENGGVVEVICVSTRSNRNQIRMETVIDLEKSPLVKARCEDLVRRMPVRKMAGISDDSSVMN